LLRRTDYYGFQFGLITDLEERRSDAEFLYTLKLSYELGLHRTLPVIGTITTLQQQLSYLTISKLEYLDIFIRIVYVDAQCSQ